MTGLLAALRGLLHRAGISLNILLVAVVAVAAVTIGPAYYAAAQSSVVQDTVGTAAPPGRGLEITQSGPVDAVGGLVNQAGARLARASRGSSVRLLGGVFGLASVTTAVLSRDTTVMLLTPVVHDTATRLRLRPKPHVYACTHLANSASLLLPVSDLTNLLAFSVAGLTLIGFGALMALPWLVAIAVEYAAFRWFFAADLITASPAAARAAPARCPRCWPWPGWS